MQNKDIITKILSEETAGPSLYQNDSPLTQLTDHTINDIIMVPLDEEVLFPYLTLGAKIEHPDSIICAKKAYQTGEPAFFFLAPLTLPDETEYVNPADIIGCVGAVGIIRELVEGNDESISIVAEMSHEAIVSDLKSRLPYMKGSVVLKFPEQIVKSKEELEMADRLAQTYEKITQNIPDNDRKQLNSIMESIEPESVRRLHYTIVNSPLPYESRYLLLSEDTYSSRRSKLIEYLEVEMEKFAYRMELHQHTMSEMANRQKEEFLRTQMQQIKKELGESGVDEVDELLNRSHELGLDEEAKKKFYREIKKLERFSPTTPDYSVQYCYLDTFLSLPWNKVDDVNFELDHVQEVLDRDHYGLEKVKERIIEQMAILKLRPDAKSSILCLYGPPGVGKTSLGKSVADALGRKYVRVALGGVHDEAEIRGHRRTYLGSMPGRIMAALEKCGSNNPVMVLDEIDKLGADFKGDPSTALLEVLDPEQNCKFHDNYIDCDYDLSKVLFIATANSLEPISAPLRDRMELVQIEGYVEDEKVEIALRHLIARNLEEHGFSKDEITFTPDSIRTIIRDYTHESGVRRLEKRIKEVLRKLAKSKASGKEFKHEITPADLGDFLGKPDYQPMKYEDNSIPGVVTGLAWTQAGGEILFIESSTSPGKEGKLVLTGNLGDVMKESAMIAMQYVKANADKIGIAPEALEFGSMHVHVPEGAVPKDGPSAGITIATSIASTLSNRKVRSHLAMTGEMSLRGKVLPVGGIKEKILAAKRAGITTVMLCSKNKKDVDEIKPEYLSGLAFHFVDSLEEVLDFALLRE